MLIMTFPALWLPSYSGAYDAWYVQEMQFVKFWSDSDQYSWVAALSTFFFLLTGPKWISIIYNPMCWSEWEFLCILLGCNFSLMGCFCYLHRSFALTIIFQLFVDEPYLFLQLRSADLFLHHCSTSPRGQRKLKIGCPLTSSTARPKQIILGLIQIRKIPCPSIHQCSIILHLSPLFTIIHFDLT